ncbi:MAG: hypothetical protein JW776_15525 [Candidatus Lokiarchaeota archaeon]|nr:hypothetical protein [Candidatus Lokiarchaeota archaeon]
MKVNKITVLVCIALFIGLYSSFAIPIRASDTTLMDEGHYVLNPQQFYQQNLGVASGLCVQGINSEAGQTSQTEYIASGGYGMGSWRSLEIWNRIYPVGLPAHQGAHVDTIYDMEKFEDSSGNMDLIYIQAGSSDRVVTQSIVGESFYLTEDWYASLASAPIDLALGEFDTGYQGAVLCCEWGEVYVIRNLNSPSLVQIADLDIGYYSFINSLQYQSVKNVITEIGDLDGDTSYSESDIVVARDANVTALSNKNTNQVIWDVEVVTSGYISSILAVGDQNADTIDDIVVGTSSSGIFLLSGADGSEIQSLGSATIGNTLRDVQVFNSTHVITGNSAGYLHVWNLGTGAIDTSLNFGWDINVILDVGDFNSDGYHEFAIGADGVVGVILGNNMTKHWTHGAFAWQWDGSSVDVFDLCLMDDMVNSYGTINATDGIPELGVIGHAGSESALFIYNTFGAWQFVKNLLGYIYIVGGGSCFDNGYVEFSASASQYNNLPITAEFIIDGIHIDATPDSNDWDGGVTYSYSKTFSNGEHTYDFQYTDGIYTYTVGERTFQIGNCGGGLEIPGAGIWMILASTGIGLTLTLLAMKKRLKN